MASARDVIAGLTDNVQESLGRRSVVSRPQLAPVASPRDAGRRPLRQVSRVEIDRVMPDPSQPRSEFDAEALARLAESIRSEGQLMPIRARWSAAHGRWIIVSGERRWRATKLAGLPMIDCYCHEEELSQGEILEQQLVENLLREDLKPVEQARAFAHLMQLNGWNGKQVAEALRIPPSTVSRALALLRLPPELQTQVDAGELAARSAYELSKLPDDAARAELAAAAATGQLTRDATAERVRQHSGQPRRKRPAGIRLSFLAGNGLRIAVAAPRRGSYHEVEAALLEALEEVRLRLRNNVRLL